MNKMNKIQHRFNIRESLSISAHIYNHIKMYSKCVQIDENINIQMMLSLSLHAAGFLFKINQSGQLNHPNTQTHWEGKQTQFLFVIHTYRHTQTHTCTAVLKNKSVYWNTTKKSDAKQPVLSHECTFISFTKDSIYNFLFIHSLLSLHLFQPAMQALHSIARITIKMAYQRWHSL